MPVDKNMPEDRKENIAEQIKKEIGCATPLMTQMTMKIKGRDLNSGLPRTDIITSDQVEQAMQESINKIVEVVKITLEKTPPELSADISDRGIYMTGGGCLIDGLDRLLQEKTGINVMIAQDTVSCVALGTGKALENLDALDGKGKR